MGAFYQQICRQTLTSLFKELNITDLISIIMKGEANLEKLASYLIVKGNEAAAEFTSAHNNDLIDEYCNLIKKIIEASEESEDAKYLIEVILKKSIIKHNIEALVKIIISGSEDPENLYEDESSSRNTLNVSLVSRLITLIQKERKKLIYTDPIVLCDLISMLLLICVAFRTHVELQKEAYICVYNLLVPIAKQPEKYPTDFLKPLLKLRVLQRMLEKCKYDITVSSGNRLTIEQKLLFEIFQQIHKIDSYLSDTWSIYTYSDTLLELEKSKHILREGKSFDIIAYTLYFNEELSGPQQHTKVYADTFHSIFD
jgi:hypothetical protein